jgi:hypothetical protein
MKRTLSLIGIALAMLLTTVVYLNHWDDNSPRVTLALSEE